MKEAPTQQSKSGPRSQTDRATELGIDLALIDENLRLTPLERMRQHDQCVRQILAVQERLGVTPDDAS